MKRLVQLLQGEEPNISNADEELELEELSSVVDTLMGCSKKPLQSATDSDEEMRIEEI